MVPKVPAAFNVKGKDFDVERLNLLMDVSRSPALELYDLLHPKKAHPG